MVDDASAIDGVSLRDVEEVDAINYIIICHDPVRISLERELFPIECTFHSTLSPVVQTKLHRLAAVRDLHVDLFSQLPKHTELIHARPSPIMSGAEFLAHNNEAQSR